MSKQKTKKEITIPKEDYSSMSSSAFNKLIEKKLDELIDSAKDEVLEEIKKSLI